MQKLISALLITVFTVSSLSTKVNATTDLNKNTKSFYNQHFTDKVNNIVVLIKFKGESEFLTDEKSQNLDNTFNNFIDLDGDGFSDNGCYSLKSYINDLTFGKTTVESSFYPKNSNGTGYLSITAPNTREYYENCSMGSTDENEFIRWAFEEIKNQIPFSAEELDRDNNGTIDHVTFLYSGVNLTKNMLWPHKADYYGTPSSYNGKRLSTYNFLNVGSYIYNIFNKASLTTAIHEFLHSFGAPDLYCDDFTKKPVSTWDVMSNNTSPAQLPLVYTRNTYLNLGVKTSYISHDGTYTLAKSNSKNKNDTLAYIIKSPLSTNEYFMMEYRKNEENSDKSIPGSGLIVYRIDSSLSGNANRTGSPYNVYVFRPGVTDAASANGDINQAFLSKESGRTSIGTSDLSCAFSDKNLYFNDGSNSGIVISDVSSASGDEISFKVKFPTLNIGDGSIENPYKVYNANDLIRINSNLNKHFIIMNDIDLSGFNWNPIGSLNYGYFSGTINGNGHTIKNMTINNTDDRISSSFIYALDNGGIIYDLNFENVNINTNSQASVVTSYNSGTLRNIKATGNINTSSNMGAGGIAGENGYLAVIDNCISSVNITCTGKETPYSKPLVGGIAMQNYQGTVKNTFSNGKITTLYNQNVGGILGKNIQPISDTSNNFYDVIKSGQDKAVDYNKNSFFPESDSGFTGIKVPELISLKANSSHKPVVEFTGTKTNVTGTFTTLDKSLLTIEDDLIKTNNKEGSAIIQYTIDIGKLSIVFESRVIVSGGLTSKYDLDGNQVVNLVDLSILSVHYNEILDIDIYDFNKDSIVDIYDIVELSNNIE